VPREDSATSDDEPEFVPSPSFYNPEFRHADSGDFDDAVHEGVDIGETHKLEHDREMTEGWGNAASEKPISAQRWLVYMDEDVYPYCNRSVVSYPGSRGDDGSV